MKNLLAKLLPKTGKGEEAERKDATLPWRTEEYVGLDEAMAFFAKNDAVDRAVPLALAQQVADEIVSSLADGAYGGDAMALANAQGGLIALKRFSTLYAEGVRRAKGTR